MVTAKGWTRISAASSRVNIKGGANSVTGFFKAGDVITIANVYDVNPLTKTKLPYLKRFTITADATGQTIWTQSDVNAAVTKFPREGTSTTAGVASLYASGGTAVNDRVALGRDRVKIVIAQGGNAKTGAFNILVDDGV